MAYANWFGGVYQDPKNFFAQFAVDPDAWRSMYPEYILTDKEWADFKSIRTAAVAGEYTANKFGWKVGDRIPIRGVFFEGTWEFDLVGKTISLGDARLQITKRIVRCAATNVEPQTGIRDLNIPDTLMHAFGHADCGVYAEVIGSGRIAPGDSLIELEPTLPV